MFAAIRFHFDKGKPCKAGLSWLFLPLAFLSLLHPAFAEEDTFTLQFNAPEYGSCGEVSINGYVGTSPGVITRMSWDWGDGIVADSWFPAAHTYSSNGDFTVTVTAFSSTGATHQDGTSVHITNAEDPLCSYIVRVIPETVVLRGGKTTQSIRAEIRGPCGELISTEGYDVLYSSSDESLAQVDQDGVVSGTGFGEAEITAAIVGLPRTAKARVYAGHFRVEPPILLLSMDGNTTGQLSVNIANADGTPVDLTGRTIEFQGSNVVAIVDTSGLVTAQQPPQSFNETPYINAILDGSIYSNNAAVIRVTSSTLGLTMQDYAGNYAAYRIADQIGPYPFGQLMKTLQVLQVSDSIYLIEQWLTGHTPNQGDLQYLVLDPGYDTDHTVPCGLSGNPVRLGTTVDNLNSCFGGTDWIQWGIVAHEMGHNFMNLRPFWDWQSGLPNGGTYSEGMTSMLGIYAIDQLIRNPTRYALAPATAENLSRSWIPLTPNASRTYFYARLAEYELDPDYGNDFDADILDGILTKLHDEYGSKFFFRLMSVFYPADRPLSINLNTETERLMFFVAACSAAANDDLRGRFHDQWGFPSDNDFYDSIYDRVRQLVFQRDPAVRAAAASDFEGMGMSNVAVFRPDSGTWYVLSGVAPELYTATQWGTIGDLPVNGDYDGDGRADPAVFRPSEGFWYILPSDFPGTYVALQWGLATDKPVPGDYDGDGKADVAVWRPDSGTWYIIPSSDPGTFTSTQWGLPTDIPVPADFDGDGKTDVAVWRQDTGFWYIVPSNDAGTYIETQWGVAADKPVPGDYDGDSKADIAVWRPDSGVWHIIPSYTPSSYLSPQWGMLGDVPTPADYDGDGRTDIAVWRGSEGNWYILPSRSPGSCTTLQWGLDTDIAIMPFNAILRSLP